MSTIYMIGPNKQINSEFSNVLRTRLKNYQNKKSIDISEKYMDEEFLKIFNNFIGVGVVTLLKNDVYANMLLDLCAGNSVYFENINDTLNVYTFINISILTKNRRFMQSVLISVPNYILNDLQYYITECNNTYMVEQFLTKHHGL